MSNKITKFITVITIAVGMAGQASATPILYFQNGQNYSDGQGNLWEFLGSFDLGAGEEFIDLNNNGIEDAGDNFPTPLNGLQAAAFLGFGNIQDLAISAFHFDVGNGAISAQEFEFFESMSASGIVEVNFMAWYDGFEQAIKIDAQGLDADKNNDGKYQPGDDRSAYVKDRSDIGDYTNYVFKRVDVPEPSTLAIFAIAIGGLAFRSFRK
ncbi:PEP-CTERM sorting domain-containing protein [Paraglaciecola aestuariivivens]